MNRLMTLASANIWARCLPNFPQECFQVTASVDTFPHNCNLCGRRRSRTCPHCATRVCKISSTSSMPAQLLWTREGTTFDTTQPMQAYPSLSEMVEKHLPPCQLICLWPSTFLCILSPLVFIQTLLLWDGTQRWIYLVEFRVCFEILGMLSRGRSLS